MMSTIILLMLSDFIGKYSQYRVGCKNDDGDVILRAKMTAEMSFCVVISDGYDIITACF